MPDTLIVLPDLDAIEARTNAASPGPWRCVITYGETWTGPDVTFIVHARYDVPALVAYARAARKRIEELERERAASS